MDQSVVRQLPQFFVVGAQKAGTTSLHAWLARQPLIRLPKDKEAHFFSDADRYARGIGWYLRQFPKYQEGMITGEVAPQYMYSEDAAMRIRQWIEAPGLIFILRHPIERAFSNFLMTVRQGRESLQFCEALCEESHRLANGGAYARDHFGYMARGCYSEQIARYQYYFPKSAMLFVLFDDLIDLGNGSREALVRISDIIGLESATGLGRLEKENPASVPRSRWLRDLLYGSSPLKRTVGRLIPSRDTRERIAYLLDRLNQRQVEQKIGRIPATTIDMAYGEIDALEKMLGIDLTRWKSRTAEMERFVVWFRRTT